MAARIRRLQAEAEDGEDGGSGTAGAGIGGGSTGGNRSRSGGSGGARRGGGRRSTVGRKAIEEAVAAAVAEVEAKWTEKLETAIADVEERLGSGMDASRIEALELVNRIEEEVTEVAVMAGVSGLPRSYVVKSYRAFREKMVELVLKRVKRVILDG